MRRLNNVVLLSGEDIDSGDVALGVTVLSGLGSLDLNDLNTIKEGGREKYMSVYRFRKIHARKAKYNNRRGDTQD